MTAMFQYVSSLLVFRKVMSAAASGGGELTTDPVDTLGHRAIVFLLTFATANPANKVIIQQAETAAGPWEDTTVEAITQGDGNGILAEVAHPKMLWLRCRLVRAGANSAVGDVWVALGNGRKHPVTQDTSTVVAQGYTPKAA